MISHIMLEPLDHKKIQALVADDDHADCHDIRVAKSFFAKNDLAEGLKNLLEAFNLWTPLVFHDKNNGKNWHIQFRDPPFNTLYLRPCDGTIEILRHDKFLIAFGILGRPQNWVRMLQWIWAFGNEVYITNVRRGTMLRPLDRRKLDALAVPDNDADCDSIRRTKAYLAKEKDLARGVMCLFEGWDVFEPRIHYDREAENNWQIKFRDSPFDSLRIKPSTDYGVVELYAFGKYVESFHILNNSEYPDWDMWQRLLIFVWDYGKRRQEQKQRCEEMQRLSPKKHAKSQTRNKRTEKPLLRKALHRASFKTQRGATPKAKITDLIPDKEDDVTGGIDTGNLAKKSLSRRLFSQQSPLRATDPNAQLGTSSKEEDWQDCQCTKIGFDGIKIGGLSEIMDC